jgi:hypothetical protein
MLHIVMGSDTRYVPQELEQIVNSVNLDLLAIKPDFVLLGIELIHESGICALT